MGVVAVRKEERGKQQMRRQVGSDCHFCSFSMWVGALYVLCSVRMFSHLCVDTGCPGKAGREGGLCLV